ncbi:hypothetical protein LC087_18260 [Bacillus carboniphilus]|uniref:Uncharacterized protein n=1 Tax=Bacillus carboniphilus TaxID=86663 RepID=A0ABY9JVT0_9BACI|nr:hypothetical protein [Bacillus carboniphilus]WLR42598.1 hypothetical protein LC087_18260 [Bacillus carboniphilus]
MNKQEFINRFKKEKLNMGEYIMVLDSITDEPLVMGCVFDGDFWKIYETRERGGHFVIKKIKSENEAFDYFYELLLDRHNYLNQK